MNTNACPFDENACVELINGKIVDAINARYFDPNVTLHVKGGRIAAMPGIEGPADYMKPDFVIDLKGKTVMPGLFNTHCHTTLTSPSLLLDFHDIKDVNAYAEKQIEKNMSECLLHGITTVRDAWAPDLRVLRNLREKIEKKTMLGPRILQSVAVGPPGGYLTETYGWIMKWMRSKMGAPPVDYGREHGGSIMFPVDASPQQVRDVVDRAIDERGADAIKVGEQKENMINFKPNATIMTLEQLAAIADQSRKRNLKSTIHHTSIETFRRSLKAGISSLAHIACDGLLTEEDIDLFLSHNSIIEPTMSVAYDMSYRVTGTATADDPYLQRLTIFRNRVHEDIVEKYWIPEFKTKARNHHLKANNEKMKMFGLFPMKTMFANLAHVCTTGVRNLNMLYQHDGRITSSNDGGIPPCTPAMMQHEIELLKLFLSPVDSKKGFSGADAVRMATINGAMSLGLEDDFGSIETGKIADLVILDGDPLKDHRKVGSLVAALFKDGRLIINNCKLQILAASKV